jgi:hypothetical protein
MRQCGKYQFGPQCIPQWYIHLVEGIIQLGEVTTAPTLVTGRATLAGQVLSDLPGKDRHPGHLLDAGHGCPHVAHTGNV